MNQPAFEALLSALHQDRTAAGTAYEDLRTRLIRFFSWEGCLRPEDWTDEVFNRVGAKIVSGERIQNLNAYASGVARLALKEAIRQQSREQTQIREFPAATAAAEDPDSPMARCFDRCLAELPEVSRKLLLDYYQGDASERIHNRQRLAAGLSISLNSLRNRALRLRDRLEECVNRCTQRDVSPPPVTKEGNK